MTNRTTIRDEHLALGIHWEVVHKTKLHQVECKASVGGAGTSVSIIVGLDGYDYKWYRRAPEELYHPSSLNSTDGKNVHVSMNGPLSLTFDEYATVVASVTSVIGEANKLLVRQATMEEATL